MNVLTQIALHIFICKGRLHVIDGRHQTCTLIHRITVCHDILHDRAELTISARLQPLTDTAIIEIADSQLLIVEQQRNQLMDIICNKILVRIDNKALIFQER